MTRLLVIDRDEILRREAQVLAERRAAEDALREASGLLLRVAGTRNPLFVGRCALCGSRVHPSATYCHAHSWAEGRRTEVHRPPWTGGQSGEPPSRKEV